MVHSVKLWIQRNGFGKGTLIILLFVILLLLYSISNGIYLAFFNQYTSNKSVVTITATDKETIYTIAGKLGSEEVIASDRFLFYTKIYTHWDIHIKKVWEGTYTIPPKTHMKDLLRILKLKE